MRRSYTLFELAVVLALIVLLAGLAVPSIQSMYADYKLQAAVDEVRGRWASMRARAISEGQPYRFSYTPGTGDFRVAPDSPGYWSGGADTAPPASNGDAPPPLVVQDSLPTGILFGTASSSDSGYFSNLGMQDVSTPDTGAGGWTTGAVFLIDGTARQDVTITFSLPDAGSMALQLRALTGGMNSHRVSANGEP